MKAEAYLCDECHAKKQEANHWWLAISYDNGLIEIKPWSRDWAEQPDVSHLCGRECTVKVVDRHMALTIARSQQQEASA